MIRPLHGGNVVTAGISHELPARKSHEIHAGSFGGTKVDGMIACVCALVLFLELGDFLGVGIVGELRNARKGSGMWLVDIENSGYFGQ